MTEPDFRGFDFTGIFLKAAITGTFGSIFSGAASPVMDPDWLPAQQC